ncbi:hypothetical protein H7F15_15695 [Pontibacter sp. Tf4]|uniref:curli-like amyloid fiber formation chaperone CsgH n=1 Tax=Pontibacter sp. Tf4 TaxID=2761620 RepID=UPI001626679D|nr:curli-like amyloid fiber formation chaperone CsgH [Pontibacter sp. Tf4]MBB6612488.1 hypothetical protein [Pontibacter sp. Tf4]
MNLLLLMCLATIVFAGQQTQATPYDARIETEWQDGRLQISNVFENNSPGKANFTYKFRCSRQGRSGTSTTSQAGAFQAAPGQTVTLSQTTVSVSPADDLRLHLDVFRDGKPVATATYSSGQE